MHGGVVSRPMAMTTRNPDATRFHLARLRLTDDGQRLGRCKSRAFCAETLQSVGMESQRAVSSTSGPSGFDPRTHALALNAHHVHLTPFLWDTGLVAGIVQGRAARQMDHSPAMSSLADDLQARAKEAEGALGRKEGETLPATTVHSFSLIPTPAFYSGANTDAFRAQWEGAPDAERYTSASRWCSVAHPMGQLGRVTGQAYVSAAGELLSDEEIVAVWEKYSGFAQDYVLDALWALRVEKRSRSQSDDMRHVVLRGSKQEEDLGEFDPPTQRAAEEGSSPLGAWRWASAPKRLIHRSHSMPSISTQTAHGTVFTTFERIVLTVEHENDVTVAGFSKGCRHLKVVIDLQSRRFLADPALTTTATGGFGLFADKRDMARRYHLLSQHTMVKVAYGVSREPTLEDIKSLPIAFKIATANLGSAQAHADKAGLVVHVLGKGLPTTIVVDRDDDNNGGGNAQEGPDPFFTHTEGALFPTEIVSFGLALRVMRLMEELQRNPAYLAMATHDLLAALEHDDIDATERFHEYVHSEAMAERLRAYQQEAAGGRAAGRPAPNLRARTRGAGAGPEGEHRLPSEFYEVLKGLPYVAQHSAEAAHLLRMVLDNALPLNMDAFVQGVSATHTSSHVDGGVISIGFQSSGLDLDRSSLHLTFVPVGPPLAEAGNRLWDPSFKRVFYRDHELRAVGEAPLNALARPFRSGPRFGNEAGEEREGAAAGAGDNLNDRAASPQTQYSDYDPLDIRDVLHLSQLSCAYDD